MNVRGWLVRLYPRAWRERYSEEFEALLGDCLLSPLEMLDVVIGALDAWFHPISETSLIWRLADMDSKAHMKDLAFVAMTVTITAILDIILMALVASAYFEGMTMMAISIATAGVVATLCFVVIAAQKVHIVRTKKA